MKKLITALLIIAFLFNPPRLAQPAAGPVVAGVCIIVAVIGGIVMIRACRPSYRCLFDPENRGTNWCSTMTRSAAYASGFEVGPINYRSYEKCMSHCAGTNSTARGPRDFDEPVWTVQKSHDLLTWTNCGKMEITYDGAIEWREPMTASTCFYRVLETQNQP